jgi:hypothetical protein
MARRSLAVSGQAGGRGIQRRSLLARGGAALGLISAQLAGLVPEMGLATAADAPKGSLRARELFGDEAERTHAAAETHPVGGLFRSFLATHRFRIESRETAVRVEDETGHELARSVGSTWSDGISTSARLIQHQAGREQKASLATWADGNPSALTIYGLRAGHVTKVATVRWSGRTITVVDEQGDRRSFTLPTRSAAHKMSAGSLASVAADPICTICQFVTGMVCGLTCETIFFVVCVVVLVLDLPAAFYCFLVSFGVCFYTCFQVTNLICSAVC